MEFQDYYAVLGISRTADEKQIKSAYRKQARKYHPDVNKDAGAEEQFKRVSEAYEVLSDTEKRAQYDKYGQAWQQYQRNGGQGATGQNADDFFRWFNAQQGGTRSNGSTGGTRTEYYPVAAMMAVASRISSRRSLDGQRAGTRGVARPRPKRRPARDAAGTQSRSWKSRLRTRTPAANGRSVST